jgi:hypothetical protein
MARRDANNIALDAQHSVWSARDSRGLQADQRLKQRTGVRIARHGSDCLINFVELSSSKWSAPATTVSILTSSPPVRR